MRNILLIFCSFIIAFSAIAQNSYDNLIEPRIQVVQNENQIENSEHFIVLENDTLYANSHDGINLMYLIPDRYDDPLMLRYYQRMVFCYLKDNPPIVYNLMQWNEPIVIYMDKEFPKAVHESFKTFISNLRVDEITHLNISFTNRLKHSNYHIKSTKEPINGYDKDYKFDSEEERTNDLLTGSTYNLITDASNKFYGGILQIHTESFETNAYITKRLKQLFYKSLGNFVADNYIDTNSLSHNNYDNSETISEFDITILKIHYSLIYNQKINYAKFKELLKLAKKLH